MGWKPDEKLLAMRKQLYFIIFVASVLTSCLTARKNNTAGKEVTVETSLDTLTWFDTSRNRLIPVAFYAPKTAGVNKKQRVVIISHGYRQNYDGSYLSYSYLAKYLASKGFFVVSIQHELPTDSLMPLTGVIQIVRRPYWERGADNILFVINELKKTKSNLDFKHIALIGHSNGGDMTALFAQKYPGIADKIITLDNRRVTLPRTKYPKVYSLRSSDQPADEGVLPTEKEQKEFDIKIIKLPNTIHNDMYDNANERQREEIRNYVIGFLNE
jgi:predicted peptidase